MVIVLQHVPLGNVGLGPPSIINQISSNACGVLFFTKLRSSRWTSSTSTRFQRCLPALLGTLLWYIQCSSWYVCTFARSRSRSSARSFESLLTRQQLYPHSSKVFYLHFSFPFPPSSHLYTTAGFDPHSSVCCTSV